MKRARLLLLLFALSASASAQSRRVSWERHVRLRDDSLFARLPWTSIGPSFLGGRVESIAVPAGSPSTIYAGVGAGNVWKTANNGLTWTPIFERESTFTIGAVAVAPSDPDIVWVGTGEVLMARSSFAGTGVFKSTDAGATWQHMGLEETHHIGRVLIHPRDPNTVYVAAIGHNYTFNHERGLFKTTDGGETWNKILYVSDRTGVVDVYMHPQRPETIFASSWERDRKAWNNVVSGPGSGLHQSTDGGRTWRKLAGGLPSGEHAGRFGLAIAPSRPDVMYAIVDNRTPAPVDPEPYDGLTAAELRSLSRDDLRALDVGELEESLRAHGVSRKHTGASVIDAIASRTLQPDDLVRHLKRLEDERAERAARRVVGGELYRSEDGGVTWKKRNDERLPTAIGYDFCLVRVSPDDANQIYVLGNYLLRSDDGGKTYARNDGKLVHLEPHDSTVLHLDHHDLWIDPENGDRMILANDGGVHLSYDRGATWLHTNNLPIGEFYAVGVDMATPYRIYGGTQDDAAVFGPDPWKHVYLDRWGGGDSYFTIPDPTDPNTIYYEHQFGRLRRKDLEANTIVDIMPEAGLGETPLRYNWMSPFFVSRHNPLTLYFGANRLFKSTNRGDHWIPISPDLSTKPGLERRGNVPYETLTTLSESPLQPRLIYTGTDDGNVWFTGNDGVEWTLVREGLPSKWVSRVVASRHRLGRVYLTLTGYREDDFQPYIYSSEDHGRTWRSIAGNLPDEPVNVIREDPANPDVLYLGTDLGAYVSLNRGEDWDGLMGGLPTTPIHDLRVHPRERELVAGTHGRSIYVLDVEPIQAMTAEVLAAELHLFPIADARLGRKPPDRGVWEHEPHDDATIYFYVGTRRAVELVVRDASGAEVERRVLDSASGLERHVFRLSENTRPGDYAVEISSGATRLDGTFTVHADVP